MPRKRAPAKMKNRTRARPRRRQGRYIPLVLLVLVLLYGAYRIGSSLMEALLPVPVSAEPGNEEEFRPKVGAPPYTIAVDAGHGGEDPGAIGVLEERQMTAATAQRLTELLEADKNYIPVQTRAGYDVTALPSERVAQANQQGADLIISIHGNSAGSDAYGFECYPITPGRSWHEESMYFARLIAVRMETAGHWLRGKGGIRYIYYGEDDEKQFVEISDSSVREEPTFTMLEYAACPSVLVEQCFVTNADDVDRFGDEDGCALSARIYYEAICAYFGTRPRK